MTARYFFHSPRGFANEADVYAVDEDRAVDWLAWFNTTQTDAYHEAYQITRKQAEKLIRRDGIGLAIDPDSQDSEFCRPDRLTPISLASATLNAIAMMNEWHKEQDLILEWSR
jgi:hypothetical protein